MQRGGMVKMKIEIKNRWDDKIILCGEYESVKDCLERNRGANLGGANLRGANLVGANLDGANLGGANLGGAYLDGANLGGAYLGGAYLGGAYLGGANLDGANLGGAYLGGAYLDGAYLGGANLGGAYLGGAYLDGAKSYSESHDIFIELVRREKVKAFTPAQWSYIGEIAVHRICWGSIKKRFRKEMLPVFGVLAKSGFGEYLEKYKQVLKDKNI